MIKQICLTLFLLMMICSCSDQQNPISDTKKTTKTGAHKTPKKPAFKEGLHYRKIENPLAMNSENIIVNEFFWYGCGHCKKFEPFLHQWEKTKPADIIIKRVPAVWKEQMKLHGKLYFIAQTLDRSEELHKTLFDKVMTLRAEKDLAIQKKQFAEMFADFGLDEKTFYQELDSFKIISQLDNSIKMMKDLKINRTPSLVVNGKYVVLNKAAKKPTDVLNIADYLIEMEKNN